MTMFDPNTTIADLLLDPALIEWRRGDYSGEAGHLGMLHGRVWTISWMGGADEAKKWSLGCALPGIKKSMRVPSIEAGKALALKQLHTFLDRALTKNEVSE